MVIEASRSPSPNSTLNCCLFCSCEGFIDAFLTRHFSGCLWTFASVHPPLPRKCFSLACYRFILSVSSRLAREQTITQGSLVNFVLTVLFLWFSGIQSRRTVLLLPGSPWQVHILSWTLRFLFLRCGAAPLHCVLGLLRVVYVALYLALQVFMLFCLFSTSLRNQK